MKLSPGPVIWEVVPEAASEIVEGVRVLGPCTAPIARIKGVYRFHMILEAASRKALDAALRGMLAHAEQARIRAEYHRGRGCAAVDVSRTCCSYASILRHKRQQSTMEHVMNWKELAAEVTAVGAGGDSSEAITGVEYDSRKVRPGSVFVAMKGGSTDGNRYIEKARAAGALGVITDSAQSFDHLLVFAPELAVLEVEHGRRALAEASAAFFGHPERKLAATGITGTNGKTTTAYLIEALLNAAQRKTVLVGTIEYHVAGETRPSVHTTPESRDLYELMAEGVERGATELVTEVSSHALDQGRAAGVSFDVAVFTNLTRDHLDYHQTMEKYFAAKRLLFDGTLYPAPRVAVINAHDPHAGGIGRGRSARPARRCGPMESARATGGWRRYADAKRRGAGAGDPGRARRRWFRIWPAR